MSDTLYLIFGVGWMALMILSAYGLCWALCIAAKNGDRILASGFNLPPGVRLRDIEGAPEPDESRRGRCWECGRLEIVDDDHLCVYCASDMERK